MHRSSSTPRISDEFFINSLPSQTLKQSSINTDHDQQQQQQQQQLLPTYNPLSHVAMKERSRLRSAENAIHAIPLVLILCAIILWFFSKPVDVA